MTRPLLVVILLGYILINEGSGQTVNIQTRIRKNLDEDWKFLHGDLPGGAHGDIEEDNWQQIRLPHDWSIEGEYRRDNPSGSPGAYLPAGTGWYRKKMIIPESAKGKKIFLEFEGFYMSGECWVNDHYLGKHPNGHLPWHLDISPFVVFGDSLFNVLVVKTDNSLQPNARWYKGSGINRHVWLTITDPLHIAPWGTFVSTPFVTDSLSGIRIVTQVRAGRFGEAANENAARQVALATDLFDPDSRLVGSVTTQKNIKQFGEATYVQEIILRETRKWSVDTPQLYTTYVRLMTGDETVDDYVVRFGIRHMVFHADSGFFLNGRKMEIRGVYLYENMGVFGSAIPKDAWVRRLSRLKEMGCNAIRTAHNPFAPMFYDLCDRMGFLVLNEIFDVWSQGWEKDYRESPWGKQEYGYHMFFDRWFEHDLRTWIRRDRNHPSVMMWSLGNEIPEQGNPKGISMLKKMTAIVRREDPSRPVTVACNPAEKANATGFMDLLDIAGYNDVDPGDYRNYYEKEHIRYPGRVLLNTGTSHYLQSWLAVKAFDYLPGQFLDSGTDYLGGSGKRFRDQWPQKARTTGLLDLAGFRKPLYYYRKSLWTTAPMIYLTVSDTNGRESGEGGIPEVSSHWNWPGDSLKKVICYTNCEKVELFMSNVSQGEKLRSDSTGLVLEWEVPYREGTLEAIGKIDDEVVYTRRLISSGKPRRIELYADTLRIKANGRDIAHVEVNLRDRNDVFVHDSGTLLHFELSGPGELAGLDAGNPFSHETYHSAQYRMYKGKCLAIVHSLKTPGKITLKVTSGNLEPAEIVINATSAGESF